MSCPQVIHPDGARLSPRPKSVSARSIRSNLENHIQQSKQESASSQGFDVLREGSNPSCWRQDTGASEQRSICWSEAEIIVDAAAAVVRREFNFMRDWIMEKNAEQKLWLESAFSEVKDLQHCDWFENAFSEMKVLQRHVLDEVQDFRVTRNTNQEAHLTPSLGGTARSEPASVAAQCMVNVQALDVSEEDVQVHIAPFHRMLSPLDVDSTSLAEDGLQKDKTKAFNRISSMVTSEVQSKKDRDSDLQHALGLTQEDMNRIHIPDEPPKECLAGFVQGGLFTAIVGLAIILNSILIGIDVNDDMHRALHNEGEQSPIFDTMNTCFTLFFTLELLLRVSGLRAWFIFGDDKGWNLFDTVLVALSLIDIVFGEGSGNLFFMRILKIFRLARVLRVIRLLRFFRDLRRVVMSILVSLPALTWALILLLLMVYVFSVVLMRAGADYLSESGTSEDRRIWRQFYGSITTTMYMLFQCISGGQEWGRMVEPLEMLSQVYEILYVFFILFIVFGLLNVLTGVFIGAAKEFMDQDFITQAEIFKERQFASTMKTLIHKLDDDKSDEITWHQFCRLTEKPEMQAFLAANGLSTSDRHLLFGLCAGSMEAEKVRTEDFVTGCHRLKGPANQLQTEALMIELELIHSLMHVNFTKVSKYLRAAEYADGKILTNTETMV